jgi:transcriptional regulator with XRE-family HTH domain
MACRLLHRTSLGLSQKASVREVGVDLSTLARWERDEKKPTGMDLIRVERFLADAAASNTRSAEPVTTFRSPRRLHSNLTD